MIVHIYVTNKCNLDCEYCYVTEQRGTEDFKAELVSDLITFIKNALKLNQSERLILDFFGGEPLLNKRLIQELIDIARKEISVKQSYIMTTNGMLLTPDNVDFILSNNIVTSVSIDGDKETHDKYRKTKNGLPSWESIIKNIKYSLKFISSISARMTFNSDTVQNLYENVKYLATIGFKEIKPIPDFFDIHWNEEKFEILKKQYKEIENYINNSNDISIAFLHKKLIKQSDCGGGTDSFSIDVNGNVYPCNYVVGEVKFCLGNVSDHSNFKLSKFPTQHAKRVECRGCSYFLTCESARCIFVNYCMTNDLHKPNGFYCAHEKLTSSLAMRN